MPSFRRLTELSGYTRSIRVYPPGSPAEVTVGRLSIVNGNDHVPEVAIPGKRLRTLYLGTRPLTESRLYVPDKTPIPQLSDMGLCVQISLFKVQFAMPGKASAL